MALFFSRDTKLFMAQGSEANGAGPTNIWGLPVLDGFSFSQSTNSSEVTLNEMSNAAGDSRRGRKVFNDSLAPAEFSFSMYARPAVGNSVNGQWEDTTSAAHSVEEAIWANFIAINFWTPPDSNASAWAAGVTSAGTTSTTYDFLDSEKTTLGTFDLYFTLNGCSAEDNQVYKVKDCVINTINSSFDIDGICTLEVSGFGSIIEDKGNVDPTDPADTTLIADGSYVAGGVFINEGTDSTDNFIRNRLTTLVLTAQDDEFYTGDVADSGDYTKFPGQASSPGDYSIALTGGNIELSNNVTFLTPETLCQVNSPIGHVSGTRTIGGSFTAYLGSGDGEGAELFDDLLRNTEIITNSFNVEFAVGGTLVPRITFALPQCHLEIPAIGIEDVISVETTFSALATSLDAADECTITYHAPT